VCPSFFYATLASERKEEEEAEETGQTGKADAKKSCGMKQQKIKEEMPEKEFLRFDSESKL
jgi:hypothetical protein